MAEGIEVHSGTAVNLGMFLEKGRVRLPRALKTAARACCFAGSLHRAAPRVEPGIPAHGIPAHGIPATDDAASEQVIVKMATAEFSSGIFLSQQPN